MCCCEILLALLKLLSPILPHTTSEAYDTLAYKEAEDIYLTDMPNADSNLDLKLEAQFDKFMKYRDVVLKALEDARSNKVIGKSFNAKLTITLDKEANEVFDSIKDTAKQLLIVSQLEFKDGDKFDVLVTPAEGHTCSRCWMIVPFINEDELCPRCQAILKK